VASRVAGLVTEGTVESVTGRPIRVLARSLCLHGDTPGAVGLAMAARSALEKAGATLAPFA
jgi:5-oxoprolinase (ATP-hydrolysing) subunit A